MLIGITGMPGSGKSTLANFLVKHWGIRIDLDSLGHEVLNDPEAISELTSCFGLDILDEEGEISRPKLGRLVFSQQREKELNNICHPKIRQLLNQKLKNPIGIGQYFIQDAALIYEAGFDNLCDFVIMIKTSFETRLKRVQKSRSWDEKELRNRDAAQNEALKTERSDFIISGDVNLSSFEYLACQLDIAIRYHLSTGQPLSHIEKFQGNHI